MKSIETYIQESTCNCNVYSLADKSKNSKYLFDYLVSTKMISGKAFDYGDISLDENPDGDVLHFYDSKTHKPAISFHFDGKRDESIGNLLYITFGNSSKIKKFKERIEDYYDKDGDKYYLPKRYRLNNN